MPYVMVPVPEEYVTQVMQLVVDMARQGAATQGMDEWDEGSVEELFSGADEASRSLLSVVAHGVVSGSEITDQAAADYIQLSMRDLTGLLGQLEDESKRAGRPTLISRTTLTEALPSGQTREKRILSMHEDVARLVGAAIRGASDGGTTVGTGGG